MSSISSERIASIEARKHELQEAMAAPNLAPDEFVRLSKDYAAIEPVAAAAREVRRLRAELVSLSAMTRDADAEMRAMAEEELAEIERKLPDAERALAVKLLPRDAADDRGHGPRPSRPTACGTASCTTCIRPSAARGSSSSARCSCCNAGRRTLPAGGHPASRW